MVIHELTDPLPADAQRALAAYESRFAYARGNGQYFRIDYGADRAAFIRSVGGEWRIFAAERAGQIAGTIEMSVRELQTPDGGRGPAAFFTEVRLVEEARRRTAAARLLQRAAAWAEPRGSHRFCIANDDNPVKPPEYTGRLGIPKYREMGTIALVRLPLEGAARLGPVDSPFAASDEEGLAAYARLGSAHYRFLPGRAAERSAIAPQWLVHPRGTGCARLEDRRKAMRLIASGGQELRPAFLSCFVYSHAGDARELLDHACAAAAGFGFNALRFCVPARALEPLRAAGPTPIPAAPATIYGSVDLPMEAEWIINAAEI